MMQNKSLATIREFGIHFRLGLVMVSKTFILLVFLYFHRQGRKRIPPFQPNLGGADRAAGRAAASGQLCQILCQDTLHHCTQRVSYFVAEVRAAEHVQNGVKNTVEEANGR